jgi:hypothetical protein
MTAKLKVLLALPLILQLNACAVIETKTTILPNGAITIEEKPMSDSSFGKYLGVLTGIFFAYRIDKTGGLAAQASSYLLKKKELEIEAEKVKMSISK